uniref:Uncharacterized protein n=1 Tax=Cucumis sativus TaxID=3659 RepID=A0A0A0KE94_CUCSA
MYRDSHSKLQTQSSVLIEASHSSQTAEQVIGASNQLSVNMKDKLIRREKSVDNQPLRSGHSVSPKKARKDIKTCHKSILHNLKQWRTQTGFLSSLM